MRPTFTARRLLEIERAYADFLAGGYPVEMEGNAETLQVARDIDRTNWLTLLGICDEAIAAGLGDEPNPLPLRCTSNATYVVTFAQAAEIVRNLRTWAAMAQANNWRMKDLCVAAETNQQLRAIDLTEGWP